MYNVRKRKIVSDRHGRRIIRNNTDIDIAGCSERISKSRIVNISSKCSLNLNLHDDADADTIEPDICNLQNNSIQPVIINSCNNNQQYIINEANKINDCIINGGNETNDELRNDIATWAISHNITRNACHDLLRIFHQYTSHKLPLDVRTLLQTPKKTDVSKICEGKYFYSGLEDIINKMLLKNDDTCVNLIFNIDDLLLAKSSQANIMANIM